MFEGEFRSPGTAYARAQEFLKLQQGSSSVREYATRFNALARFAPSLAGTEAGRVQKFIHGLHPAIARDVLTGDHPPQRFSDALERATRSEMCLQWMGMYSR